MNYRLLILLTLFAFSHTVHCRAGTGDIACRITPEKIRYKPGTLSRFVVDVSNSTPNPMKGMLQASIIGELGRVEHEARMPLEIPPKSKKPMRVEWNVPKGDKWGHEIRVRLLDEKGAILGSAIEFFTVGDRAWPVGHWNSCCNTGKIRDFREIRSRVIGTCLKKYCTTIDCFSWQPSGWETMAPPEDEWISGQTSYPERKAVLKRIVAEAHAAGMEVFSYYMGNSWGPAGVEFIRAHPEWWNYDRLGRPFPGTCSYSVTALDRMRKHQTLSESPWCWFSTGIIWNDSMKAFMLDQLKQSVEMFGWDGFRSDGLPFPGNVYDRTGQYHDVLGKDPVGAKVAFINELRAWMARNLGPECDLHFNAGTVVYGAERGDPRLFRAMARNSYVLWESALYASVPGSDLNDMRSFARFLHPEVQAAREVGGYRHVGWMRELPELLEATATACGAKVDMGYGWDSHSENTDPPLTRVFTFRFSRYFWDPALAHPDNAARFLSVKCPSNIWWKDLLQVRTDAGGKTSYILHLINLPEGYPNAAKDSVPRSNIQVALKNGIPSRVRAFVLSPDFGRDAMCRELPVTTSSGTPTATIPELRVWSVLVFEVDK